MTAQHADGSGVASAEARRFVDDVARRHGARAVRDALAALRPLRALVVGEAIVDEYSYCVLAGKASKDPMLSARHLRVERQAGGAVACANHVAGFCAAVELVTCLGAERTHEDVIRDALRPNVSPRFLVRDGCATITKRRYVAEPALRKLFEIVVMDDTPLPVALEDRLLAHLETAMPACDLVIATDYGHGLLGRRAVELLAARARFLAVNAQANPSNLGFHVITRYPRADYACLDEREARLAARDRWSPLPALAASLRGLLRGVVAVTRAHEGALLCGGDDSAWEVPALGGGVVDPMGAGDAYLAVTAPAVAAGLPLDVVGLLGGAAAAVAVRIVGNRSPVDGPAVERLVADLSA